MKYRGHIHYDSDDIRRKTINSFPHLYHMLLDVGVLLILMHN